MAGPGITVPARYKSEMRKTRRPEYNEATIRDYVKKHPNEVITIKDLMAELDGLSSTATLVRKLVDSGKLYRYPIHTPGKVGKAYGYVWHDNPLDRNGHGVPKTRGLVNTIPIVETSPAPRIEFKEPYANITQLAKLNDWFMDFSDTGVSAELLHGANEFRRFVRAKARKDAEDSIKNNDEENK